MPAHLKPALSPEMLLIAQQESASRRNASLLTVLDEEFGGISAGWTLPEDERPSPSLSAKKQDEPSFWSRLSRRNRARQRSRRSRPSAASLDHLPTECPTVHRST
jgi:hypothetical protein